MRYDFQWDFEKAKTNRRKHGVGFEEAATVFLDPRMLTLYDKDHSEAEDRWLTLGISSKGRLLVVCHTFRRELSSETAIRIFSSRKATQREMRQYGQYEEYGQHEE